MFWIILGNPTTFMIDIDYSIEKYDSYQNTVNFDEI